jgi:hypothetical protein
MVNPFARVNWSPSPREIRVFALTLAGGGAAVALLMVLLALARSRPLPLRAAVWLAGGTVAAAVLSIAVPVAGRWLYRAWYALGCSIGIVTANVALMLVFYVVVTPLGLARRLTGRAPLLRAPDPSRQSYWTDVPPPGDRRGYRRQF